MDGEQELILSSRVRLARNVSGYCFPDKLNLEEGDRLTDRILEVMKEEEDPYHYYRLRDLDYLRQLYFLERQVISPGLVSQMDRSSFFLSEDRKVSIMVGEEDHLRLQCIEPGLHLSECYYRLTPIEERMDEKLGFAFDSDFGYLTACPSNLGTGLRAGVMIHLPALEYAGMKPIIRSLSRLGFVIRGLHGEGTEALGSVFQVSNEKTLGDREENYIGKLEKVVLELVDMENRKRKELYTDSRTELEDMVHRAYGILRYAKKISYEEAMRHLSSIKLGLDLSLLKAKKDINIYAEMEKIQNATLQIDLDNLLEEEDRKAYRAVYLNRLMKEVF